MRPWKVFVIALVGLCGCDGRPAAERNVGAEARGAVRQAIGEAVNNANDDELDAIWKGVLLPDSAYAVPDAPTPTMSDADRPTSIDDFAPQFVRLYQRDIYAPFIELADWGSSTNEQKRAYLADLRPIFTANATHQAAQRVVAEAIPIGQFESKYYFPTKGETSLALTPEPTHILRVRASGFPPRAGAEKNAARPTGDDEGDDLDEAGADEENMDDERELEMEGVFAVGVRDGKYYFCTVKHD